MHAEFAHYFASLRPLQQFRWALAGCFAFAAVRLYRISASLMPGGHPTRRYILARVEATERTVLPAMAVGLPIWVKRLGQVSAASALAAMILLLIVGGARTTHHIDHYKQERATDLFRK